MTASRTARLPRRQWLRQAAGAAVAAPFLFSGEAKALSGPQPTYTPRAVDLMKRSLVIDMLSPLYNEASPAQYGSPLSDKDRAAFMASGVSCFHNSTSMEGPTAHRDVLAYIAAWSGFVARNTDLFCLVGRAEDIDRAKAAGKIAVMIGVQSSDHFREPSDVAMFYALGQRCSQLTYNTQDRIGSGCTERVDGGLTDFGASIVKAMNDVGMLVDLSHCGPRTTLDGIETSSRPVAITHSNCKALNDHPRCKSDEAIRKLAARGGVMGITEVRVFVSAKEPTTVEDIVNHIDHVAQLVGVEHVGVGTDSDLRGYDNMSPGVLKAMQAALGKRYGFRAKSDTDGFDQPQRLYTLTEALIRRGYSDSDIQLVLGGNFRRLLGEILA